MRVPYEPNKKKKSVYYFFALLPVYGIGFVILLALTGFFDSNSLLGFVFAFVIGGIVIQAVLQKKWNIKED
jgi:biotin transporter BioY